MKPLKAMEILRDHFAGQSWTDEEIDGALDTIEETTKLASAIDRALEHFDLELSRPSPQSHFVRFWFDGGIVTSVEASDSLADLLDRTSQALIWERKNDGA